jgi:hypothetical protein
MSHELRTATQGCLEQFKLLIEISVKLGLASEGPNVTYGSSWIGEQYARFKIWAGNIGTFAEGHASLDYRLRDSLSTQRFMLYLLIALADFIHRGKWHLTYWLIVLGSVYSNSESNLPIPLLLDG